MASLFSDCSHHPVVLDCLQCTKPEGEVLGDLMVMSAVKVSPRFPDLVLHAASGPKKMMVGKLEDAGVL